MEILYFAKSGEHPGELGRGGEKHNVIIVDFFFYSLFFFPFLFFYFIFISILNKVPGCCGFCTCILV